MADQQSNNNPNITVNYATTGMNTDSYPLSLKPGQILYALNGLVENFDGNSITYQNEGGNTLCVTFPAGMRVIGVANIQQINKIVFWLVNPDTRDCEIGYVFDGNCQYTTIISSKCLSFNLSSPIREAVVKTTNCSTQIYWTDNYNPRRYLDLDNLPWVDVPNPDNAFKPLQQVGLVDCNKLLVQPNFSLPVIEPTEVHVGGELVMGTYQFAIQYSNILGEGYTSYYNITNPLGIYQQETTPDFNLPTSKAIDLKITDLDTTGLYDYFNIAVIKTINNITSVDLVGTFPVVGTEYKYTYTGTEKSSIQLTIADIFETSPYYNTAEGVFQVDNVLGWYGLTSAEDINFQPVWSKVKLQWETYKIPYNNFEGYNNGLNTSLYRGYMRDEVYALEGRFIFKNGMKTKSFHIPGRAINAYDLLPVVAEDNPDSASILQNPCDTPTDKKRWEVYNTGTLIDFADEYKNRTVADNCYVGKYQYGDMAYWQSTNTYPNNPLIWGELANTNIRHHKFPDSLITHIHDNNTGEDPNYTHSIFPIGVRVDIGSIYSALKESGIDQSIIDQIAGFEIARGNRASNKSVIAKGIFNNVGKYTYTPVSEDVTVTTEDSQTYYFPNYPYNDLREDPFFTTTLIQNHGGFRPDKQLNGFADNDSRSRFSFHSPDTHFYQPTGIDSGILKVETIEYGESYGHFVSVNQNANYLFLNKNGYNVAYGGGVASTINGTVTYTTPWDYGVGANFAPENFAPSFQATLDILNKILPYSNFGYSFNSYGLYNKYFPVPNAGTKQRAINFGKYLNDGYNQIEGTNVINNFQRESSVYLNTAVTKSTDILPYPHEYDSSIKKDTSRYNISSYTNADLWDTYFNLFLSAKTTTVSDSSISTELLNSSYTGPQVYIFNCTNQFKVLPTIGDTYDYLDATGVKLGTLQLMDINMSPCIDPTTGVPSTTFDCGTYTFLLISGNQQDITNSLQFFSSTQAGGTSVIFEYNNFDAATRDPLNNKLKVNTSVHGTPVYITFDSLKQESYQVYIAGNIGAFITANNEVKNIYSGINTEADLEALNVSSPSTIEDFDKVVAYNAYLDSYAAYQEDNSINRIPETVRKSNISSYYGSIKRQLLNQWGQIYSYETISTGYYSPLYQSDGTPFTSIPTVFGGDIFINRFALKTKLPIFDENTVLDADQTDIEYDQIANFTYPMFWFSTRPVKIGSDIAKIIQSKVGAITTNIDANAVQVMYAGVVAMEITFDILKEILNNLGVRNLNLDNFKSKELYEQGLMYLFVYGIPYFFVESEVNVDYRQATNSKEGDFYPHVSSTIPDEWVQEAFVSIANDNTYNYNQSYSKQNKEDYFGHLREDYDPNKPCLTNFPNRAIWSDQSTLEETKNNWLVYKPAAYHDFPKAYGGLTAIDTIENREVLVRFDNKSQIYNALTVVNTSLPQQAYLGNSELFSQQPIDLSETDIGYAGSQHKFLLRTEFGHIFIDAVRGEVLLLQGSKVTDITSNGMDKWFSQFLPFNINKYFPAVDIDNHFSGVGLHGVYDMFYQRLIITKLDYIPLSDAITYDNGKFYFNPYTSLNDTPTNQLAQGNVICNQPLIEIQLTDPKYFCNKSWSISYSFKTGGWIAYHSYLPNYYVPFANYFQSGNNTATGATLWNHNQTFSVFNNFYGKQYPYILEYPLVFQGAEDQILQSVRDYCVSRKYTSLNNYYSTNDYFNKSIISNDYQCTGVLNLIPKPQNDLSAYLKYPKFNSDSKDILVTKTDNIYQYNTFWNISNGNTEAFFSDSCDLSMTNKVLNTDNLDYSTRSFRKDTIRGKNAKVRHILDNKSDVKLLSQFTLFPTQTSYK